MPNSHEIAKEMGIRLHGKRSTHPNSEYLPPKHAWCGKTIYLVAKKGEEADMPELIYDVLGVFLEAERNHTQLFGDAISGVARWALRNRITTEEFAILRHAEAFKGLDIRMLRDAVKHHGIAPRSPQIAFLVASQMEAAIWALRQ